MNKEEKKIYMKAWRENNKKHLLKYAKQYRKENHTKLLKKEKEKRIINKITINKKHKDYFKLNPKAKEKKLIRDKSYAKNNRDKINESRKLKKETNLIYKLSCVIRTSVHNTFKRKTIPKKSKTLDIIGCSYEELKSYFEAKFESWMNWENRGLYNGTENYGWDIDHIIPISTAKTEEDVIRLNHYTNLQPLCSKINRDIKRGSF